jgi:hypothetical protein
VREIDTGESFVAFALDFVAADFQSAIFASAISAPLPPPRRRHRRPCHPEASEVCDPVRVAVERSESRALSSCADFAEQSSRRLSLRVQRPPSTSTPAPSSLSRRALAAIHPHASHPATVSSRSERSLRPGQGRGRTERVEGSLFVCSIRRDLAMHSLDAYPLPRFYLRFAISPTALVIPSRVSRDPVRIAQRVEGSAFSFRQGTGFSRAVSIAIECGFSR